MEDYILFLDETSATNENPYFCLGGFITKRNYYESVITKEIRILKENHNIPMEVPLHYTEIKNSKKYFSIYKKKGGNARRALLLQDFANLLKRLDIITLGTYGNVCDIKYVANNNRIHVYDVMFLSILDQYMAFLSKKEACGSVYIESRTFNEDAGLHKTYYNYLNNGSALFKSETICAHLGGMAFIIKNDNCAGLQVADFIPIGFTRYLNSKTNNFELNSIIVGKLYEHNTSYERILGLRNYFGI